MVSFCVNRLVMICLEITSLNLLIRASIKWGGAQLMPTACTLLLLFILSRHSLNLSPDGAFSPSTELKHIQDGTSTFCSSSNSTQACKFVSNVKMVSSKNREKNTKIKFNAHASCKLIILCLIYFSISH